MRILLSNDDGYLAPGLGCLAGGLTDLGDVVVVAPDRDRSGASNSLTLDRPIRAVQAENGFVRVNGTPTDCVHLAITGLLENEPDIVISGINNGANLGDDVIYSGTVAAAVEGRFLGYPAIAVSLAGRKPFYYESALQAVRCIVQRLQRERLPRDLILNVNVPDRPWADIGGFRVTRLGFRHKAEPVIKSTDPRGNPIYWIGASGAEQDAGPGTDFHAIREGYVSVTPLQVDLTRHFALDVLRSWMENLEI
ncbi:MAG: 5'/3'-nucleotidase SurE [Gammaproteobacteria bacterium]|jgi:5'-nucleotidase|nr:5'/3'-nucleotidase SurE [Gammaproteobacteria bacterium]